MADIGHSGLKRFAYLIRASSMNWATPAEEKELAEFEKSADINTKELAIIMSKEGEACGD